VETLENDVCCIAGIFYFLLVKFDEHWCRGNQVIAIRRQEEVFYTQLYNTDWDTILIMRYSLVQDPYQ